MAIASVSSAWKQNFKDAKDIERHVTSTMSAEYRNLQSEHISRVARSLTSVFTQLMNPESVLFQEVKETPLNLSELLLSIGMAIAAVCDMTEVNPILAQAAIYFAVGSADESFQMAKRIQAEMMKQCEEPPT